MARRVLLLVDGLLLVAAAFLGVRLYEAWGARTPTVAREAPPAASTEAAAPPAAAAPRSPLTTFAVVAERNLFSPTRTETAPEPPRPATGAGAPAPPAPKPRLYGIVLLAEGRGRAYLEDVQRRRVFAYSVGDLVGDARLEQIRPDRVVLRRGAETFEVLLADPSKPRQSAAPSQRTIARDWRSGPSGSGKATVASADHGHPSSRAAAASRPAPFAAEPGRAGTADRGGMIEKLTRRRIAVLGLAVLGGCAGPGASGTKSPPRLQGPRGRDRRRAPAPADRPVALPGAPPRPEPEGGSAVPPIPRRADGRSGTRHDDPGGSRQTHHPHRPEPDARSSSTSTTPTSRPSSRRQARSRDSTTRSAPASPGRRSRSRPPAGSRRTRSSTSSWPCSRSTASRPSARAISTRSCR